MKLFLTPLPVMPGEGTTYRYMPPGRSIVVVLTGEHSQFSQLSRELASGQTPKRGETDRFTAAVTRHLSAERQYLYPALAATQGAGTAENAIGQDRKLLTDLASLGKTEPGSQTFRDAAQVIETGLRHHIHACEADMFPVLIDAVSKADLVRLGNRVELAQEAAPTRPHPRGPMRPPWNKLTDAAIGAVDKLRDLASGRRTHLDARPVDAGTKFDTGRAK